MKRTRRGLTLLSGTLMLALTALAGPATADDQVDPASTEGAQIAGTIRPTLSSGKTMTGGWDNLSSPTGQHVLDFTSYNGITRMAIVGECQRHVLAEYTSPRSSTDSKLVMQGDGNLVLYVSGSPVWHTRTQGNPGAYLTMQGDRNLVVYSAAGRPLWNSATACNVLTDYSPNDGSGVSRTLDPGEYMQSNNRAYRLIMQGDGNLVLYKGTRALWNTRTQRAGDRFTLDYYGQLKVGSSTWTSNTSGTYADHNDLVLQDDGNLVLYRTDGVTRRVVWATYTNGR